MNPQIVRLIAIAGIAGLISSYGHYLLTVVDAKWLKVLAYISVAIIGIMAVVLDDEFAAFFKSEAQGIFALAACCFTAIFLSGSYRAFTLNQQIEGVILVVLLASFWIVLLALYLKLVFLSREG